MLIFMTYNTWLCLSVSLGAAAGWVMPHHVYCITDPNLCPGTLYLAGRRLMEWWRTWVGSTATEIRLVTREQWWGHLVSGRESEECELSTHLWWPLGHWQGVCAILIFNKYTYFWQFANLIKYVKIYLFSAKMIEKAKIRKFLEKLFAIFEVYWCFKDFLLIFLLEVICSV